MIGEDTDLIVLLLHHGKSQHEVFFSSGSAKKPRVCKIRNIQESLGDHICDNILFAHAFTGCDTVSQPFNISKVLPIKLLKNEKDCTFSEVSRVFNNQSSDSDTVAKAGERAFVKLYGGKPSDSLDLLRLVSYDQKVARNKTKGVQAKDLPPTSASAKYHSLRVFFQIQEWATLGGIDLNPNNWGWQLCDGMFIPIMTDLPPAPDYLLRIITCSCKTNCSSRRCTCRKHGLTCTSACGECRGLSCLNAHLLYDMDS